MIYIIIVIAILICALLCIHSEKKQTIRTPALPVLPKAPDHQKDIKISEVHSNMQIHPITNEKIYIGSHEFLQSPEHDYKGPVLVLKCVYPETEMSWHFCEMIGFHEDCAIMKNGTRVFLNAIKKAPR